MVQRHSEKCQSRPRYYEKTRATRRSKQSGCQLTSTPENLRRLDGRQWWDYWLLAKPEEDYDVLTFVSLYSVPPFSSPYAKESKTHGGVHLSTTGPLFVGRGFKRLTAHSWWRTDFTESLNEPPLSYTAIYTKHNLDALNRTVVWFFSCSSWNAFKLNCRFNGHCCKESLLSFFKIKVINKETSERLS